MVYRKYWILVVSLALAAALIHVFSNNARWVEEYYSTGMYPYIAVALRYLLGWIPFSLGDLLYGALLIWLLAWLANGIRNLFTRRSFRSVAVPALLRLATGALSIYIYFNLVWGMNYNRQGIAAQLGMTLEKYTVDELVGLNQMLVQKVNASKAMLLKQQVSPMRPPQIRQHSLEAYTALHGRHPFLQYQPSSMKASLWGWLGNYLGFMGYYNPFTGEGQVNTTIPAFLQPYTTCHEIAHQIGYAKENEANFVGYLAAAASTNESFHYSVYLDLLLYANRNLYWTDSSSANTIIGELQPAVKADLREWKLFNLRHKNPVEPVVRWLYGKYLENNEQPSGVLSYDEVTGFLIAYNKKFGKL